MSFTRQLKHTFVCLSFCLFLVLFIYFAGGFQDNNDPVWKINPFESYGMLPTIILYIFRGLTCLSLPLTVANFFGLMCFNTFPSKPHLKSSPLLGPSICFRIVTRGDYPLLVRENVECNLAICSNVGLDNFIIEVVTDAPINLPKLPRTREVIVPFHYSTRAGTLYKARALQYCLEPNVNILSDDDWIVHLDEETILTEEAVVGIFNFVTDGSCDFGQGVITYANNKVVNWTTTLSDSVRVGIDYGSLRFTFKVFGKPVFSWKGSFVVANAGAERKVSFDHGPEASIAEDCYFAMIAFRDGYRFGFVEGEMFEKSTFTVKDFVYQRKRWLQGIYSTVCCPLIPIRCKFGIGCMVLSWICMPLTTMNLLLAIMFPFPVLNYFNVLFGFVGGVMAYLFLFGTAKSFSRQKLGTVKYLMVCWAALFNIPVALFLEIIATLLWLVSRKRSSFYIVEKDWRPRITVA